MIEKYTQTRANLNTRVGKLFAQSWYLRQKHEEIFNNAIERLKITEDNCKEFEDFLNALYLKNSSNARYKTISTQVDQTVVNFINKQLKNIKIDSNQAKLISSYTGQKEHSTRIALSTVTARFEEIKALLDQPTLKLLRQNFQITQQQINQLFNDFQQIIESNSDEILTEAAKQGGYGYIRKNKITEQMIQSLDDIYYLVRYINGKNLGQVYGDAFEKSLNTFNILINKYQGQVTNSLIAQLFRRKTMGQSSNKDRGTLESEFYDTGSQSIIGSGDNEILKITAFDPKQGKVDVVFDMPNEDSTISTFRISAKSWLGLFDHDFGSTTLFNALARTSGVDYTLAYGLVVGYYNPVGKLWPDVYAHHFAKTCILVDTIMGYSQQNDYADTIVIQDRTDQKRPIKVYSIKKLLMNMKDNIDSVEYFMYNYNTINIRKINKTEWWLKTLQQQMHQIKVGVSSGVLTKAK